MHVITCFCFYHDYYVVLSCYYLSITLLNWRAVVDLWLTDGITEQVWLSCKYWIGSDQAHRLSLAEAADRYELSNGRNATSDTNCVRNPSIHSLTYIIATLDTNCVRNLSIHIVSHTLDGSCPWNFCMSSGKVAPPAAKAVGGVKVGPMTWNMDWVIVGPWHQPCQPSTKWFMDTFMMWKFEKLCT